jgi:hypothetical protein
MQMVRDARGSAATLQQIECFNQSTCWVKPALLACVHSLTCRGRVSLLYSARVLLHAGEHASVQMLLGCIVPQPSVRALPA